MTDLFAESENLRGLPRKVRVGQFTLRFRVCTPKDYPDLNDNNGLTVFEEGVVYLDAEHITRASAEHVLNTVQHEVCHIINMIYGVDDESTEEQFVERNTNGLIAFWIDNPKFEAWRRRMLRQIKKNRTAKE